MQCALDTNASIPAGRRVQITSDGITNPTTVAANNTVSVTTTSDPASVTSATYATTTAGQLSAVSAALGNLAPSATTQYVVGFTLSASGALANTANSRIDITFPAGTTFGSRSGGETVVDTTTGQDVGFCSARPA